MKFKKLMNERIDDYDVELKKAINFFEKGITKIVKDIDSKFLQYYSHPDEKVKFIKDVIKNAEDIIKKFE